MTDQQFVLVVYDISNDKRRTKLHNVLLDFGSPVQYSVFECLLNEIQLQKMQIAIRKVIRPRKDHVRWYYLCKDCVSRTEVSSGKEVLVSHDKALIV